MSWQIFTSQNRAWHIYSKLAKHDLSESQIAFSQAEADRACRNSSIAPSMSMLVLCFS